MHSDLPKVLHPVAGRSMLSWVLEAVLATHPSRVVAVVGYESEAVIASLPDGVEWVIQEPQLGTGHAVATVFELLAGVDADTPILVTSGDMPLVDAELFEVLLRTHREWGATITMTAAIVEDTMGFGRVVRDQRGLIRAVVEDKDADDTIRAIKEVNAGIYVFNAGGLFEDLAMIRPDNVQGEYYLTEMVGIATARGDRVEAVFVDRQKVVGVNTLDQLAVASKLRQESVFRSEGQVD